LTRRRILWYPIIGAVKEMGFFMENIKGIKMRNTKLKAESSFFPSLLQFLFVFLLLFSRR